MRIYIVCIICLFTFACSPRYEKYFINETDVLKYELTKAQSECNLSDNYGPDQYTSIRYIRVNFHIIQDSNGEGNFNEAQAKNIFPN